MKIPPKVLYFDIETALIKTTVFQPGRQWIGWKSMETDSFVICWGAAWMHKKQIRVISDCVTSAQAKNQDDSKCLKGLHALMDEADYIVGHNMRAFDWKTVSARFLIHGWDAPHDAKIVDTLNLSRRRFRAVSHALDAWNKALGHEKKDDMRREDWEACLQGKKMALDKMHEYCRGDIRSGVKLAKSFQRYIEQATGRLMFT